MNLTTFKLAIDRLRKGIENENMEQIKEAFYELAGETIDTPAVDAEPEEEVREEEVRVSHVSKDLDFSIERQETDDKQRNARREPIQVGENQFTDDGIEDKNITTPDVALTPRKRPEATKVEVICHVCDKTYHVNPSLLGGEFYRCNECVGKQ